MALTLIGGDRWLEGCVFWVLRDYARGTNRDQSTQDLQAILKSLGFTLKKKEEKREGGVVGKKEEKKKPLTMFKQGMIWSNLVMNYCVKKELGKDMTKSVCARKPV